MNPPRQENPVSPSNMRIFATAVGILVANLYYAQPLLARIAMTLGVDPEKAGYLVTLVQLGYAAGVLFIVPLGDSLDRRNLLSAMLALSAAALIGAAASPSYTVLALCSVLLGTASSATMVIIPYVASHSAPDTRGKRVGQVMTGLFLGILMARTVSGLVAQMLSWRLMYVVAALMAAVLIPVLRRCMVPDQKAERPLAYTRLLASLGRLIMAEGELRWRAWYALAGLCAFSTLWTGLTFLLSAPPYHYNTAAIGMFGLIGAAGALSANLAGRFGDRGYAGIMTGMFALLLTLSWGLLWMGKASLAALVFGIFMVDVAVQGLQVTHQSVIYQLAPHARSRITSIFITAGFVGMSLGSALASWGYAWQGWMGVCLAGAGASALLPLSWLFHGAGCLVFRRPVSGACQGLSPEPSPRKS